MRRSCVCVILTDPPVLRVERDVVAAVVHQSSTLTVFAAAEPRPQFTWHNGSTPLAPSAERVDINATTVATPGEWKYISTLTLSAVDLWDLTVYRVVVSNDYGSNQTTIRLTEASEYAQNKLLQ